MPNINESASYINQARTKALMSKWSKRLAITEGALRKHNLPGMSLEKKAALAVTLENTQRVLEATQASNIGQYKRFALDLVQSVVPNLLAYDLFSVGFAA